MPRMTSRKQPIDRSVTDSRTAAHITPLVQNIQMLRDVMYQFYWGTIQLSCRIKNVYCRYSGNVIMARCRYTIRHTVRCGRFVVPPVRTGLSQNGHFRFVLTEKDHFIDTKDIILSLAMTTRNGRNVLYIRDTKYQTRRYKRGKIQLDDGRS